MNATPPPVVAPPPAAVAAENNPAEAPALRAVRSFALLVLIAHLTLFIALLLLSNVPLLRTAATALISWESPREAPVLAGCITIAIIVLVPFALLYIAWRLRLRSWWWIGGGYLAIAPVLTWLAWDDPVLRRPLTIDEIAPAFPGAEKSFEVLMRYGKLHPLAQNFKTPKYTPAGGSPEKPDEWAALVRSRRGEIEAGWTDLQPVREWWAEVATFDRIGDLTRPRLDAEIIAFALFRALSQHACAIASLQALDGDGDGALATLQPILEVAHKLEPSSRTLVRFMVARVIQNMTLQTAEFVLNRAPTSAGARARFASALQGGSGGEAGARRMIAIEYAISTQGGLFDYPLGDMVALTEKATWLRQPLNLLSPLVYHRRASLNLFGDLTADLQDLAARRESGKMAPRLTEFMAHEGRPRFKNFMGALLLSNAIPAYTKVTETYWKIEDRRASLHARLTKA